MVEYELFKAREREILADAERARVRQSAWRARRAQARIRRAERAAAGAVTTLAVIEAGDMHRHLHLLAR
ncbi:hypothetical protein [Embleya scabrispora]|uniref:hypothetical protein n=1 Tax=Embleya scabrispora TaxID=159449 RepID=UPI00037A8B50|nr:hypothetical protein [Embleya scabrispora]MYS87312.1 hypothetical protein [Streptomyces sp. SID5474]